MDYVIGFFVIAASIALSVIFASKVKALIDSGNKFAILVSSALVGVSALNALTGVLIFILEQFK